MEHTESRDLLEWIQAWYERHCNGDWEHQYRIIVETLDNPGWMVRIDLKGTALEGHRLSLVKIDNSETDWIQYRVDNDRFEGAGGSKNLIHILQIFRRLVENNGS